MASFITKLATVATFVAPIFGTPARSPPFKIRSTTGDVISDSYIVVYKDTANASMIETHMDSTTSKLSKRDNGAVGATYHLDTFKGYHIKADSATIAEIAAAPEVAYIEKEIKVSIAALTTQNDSTWGLAAVSHRSVGYSDYIYDTSAGEGVTIYVVDTGIYTEHEEFQGRATLGANFVMTENATDLNGHGTHVSGTAVGITYGVAKKAKVVGVKVCDANGDCNLSDVLSGLQWIVENVTDPDKSVVSISLSAPYSDSLNAATAASVTAGITTVVAAGNQARDVSDYSPASEASAITVAAISSNSYLYWFSNFGDGVDVFAPGSNVLSSWIGSPNATAFDSGTSMATPHISGLAAYLIALEGISGPTAIVNRIQALATVGKIQNAQSNNNLLGYNGNDA